MDDSGVPLHQMTASAVGNTPESDIDALKEKVMRGVMHADEKLFKFKVRVVWFLCIFDVVYRVPYLVLYGIWCGAYAGSQQLCRTCPTVCVPLRLYRDCLVVVVVVNLILILQ